MIVLGANKITHIGAKLLAEMQLGLFLLHLYGNSIKEDQASANAFVNNQTLIDLSLCDTPLGQSVYMSEIERSIKRNQDRAIKEYNAAQRIELAATLNDKNPAKASGDFLSKVNKDDNNLIATIEHVTTIPKAVVSIIIEGRNLSTNLFR